jgi:hypothetical protein
LVGGGATMEVITDAPESSSRLRRRLTLAGAVLVGAAAVGVGWLFVEGRGGSTVSALEQDPGIPPPDYVYLDNARVVSYLGQIEGGLSESEKQTVQQTENRNAGVGGSGVQIGGAAGRSSSVERVVTPTATARFYRLLDRLDAHGYLRTIDTAAAPEALVPAFAAVPEGTFVRLRNCTLRIPTYVQLEQLMRASGGRISAFDAYVQAGQRMPPVAQDVLSFAELEAGRRKAAVGSPTVAIAAAVERRLTKVVRRYVEAVGPNPRVPISTCDGETKLRPRGVDLLFPIQLADLSSEKSLVAGPVTVVGKIVRAVRQPDEAYVDEASLALFGGPVGTVDGAVPGSGGALSGELAADVTVLSPGVVILPIAIYK